MNGSPKGTTVVVLGAGFSIGAGQPLTRSILPSCGDFVNPLLLRELDSYLQKKAVIDRPLVELEEDIEDLLLRLQSFKSAVPQPIYNQYLGTPTHIYEEPFVPGIQTSAFQMRMAAEGGEAVGADGYAPNMAYRTLMLLYWVMACDRYEPHPMEGSRPGLGIDQGMPPIYRAFAGCLPGGTVVITTNYDDVLERALVASGRLWSYAKDVHYAEPLADAEYRLGKGTHTILDPWYEPPFSFGRLIWARLDWRPSATMSSAEILVCRLHGSFRWLQCRNCSRFYSVDWWAAHPTGAFVGHFVPEDPAVRFACWDGECMWIPLIGAILPDPKKRVPSPFQVIYDHWKEAALAVRRCSTLVIVGSALRETDRFLRGLVKTAGKRAREVWVVNPSPAAVELTKKLLERPVEHLLSLADLVSSDRLGNL